jgi:hypothetical protein
MADNGEVTLVVEQVTDEAAFEAGFKAETAAHEIPQPETVVVPEPTTDPVDEPAETPETPETLEEPKLFAGLTEEQLVAALAKNSTLQGTVDKMAGRMGALMQQIEAIRSTPPTTQAAQVALDLKLEKLGEAFPHIAELLREDLGHMQAANAEPVAPAPAGITQEQIDAMFAERLGNTQAQLNEQIERKVLGVIHPDWEDVIRTPNFALYRDNVLSAEAGQALMASEDSRYIANGLTEYKAWLAKAMATVVKPAAPKPNARLANAVAPTRAANNRVASSEAINEEDAFAAGFSKERERTGHYR